MCSPRLPELFFDDAFFERGANQVWLDQLSLRAGSHPFQVSAAHRKEPIKPKTASSRSQALNVSEHLDAADKLSNALTAHKVVVSN
jgi:hypothetical protein